MIKTGFLTELPRLAKCPQSMHTKEAKDWFAVTPQGLIRHWTRFIMQVSSVVLTFLEMVVDRLLSYAVKGSL